MVSSKNMTGDIQMFKGNQFLRVGIAMFAFSLLGSVSTTLPEAFTSFFMGMGSALILVGTVKRLVEVRNLEK